MSGIDSIQFADIARLRTEQSAHSARHYTQRHAPDSPRADRTAPTRHWRIHWPHAARARIAG
jgi:hypothetical protein